MVIRNGLVFAGDCRFRKLNLRIGNGCFTEVSQEPITPAPGEEVVDAGGMRVLPGLTDIHFHGCMGHDLCDGTEEAIIEMARFEQRAGVTAICPATMTLPAERLLAICAAAADHREGQTREEALLIGINLEGPFISPHRAGAQNPAFIRKPDAPLLRELIDASGGLARLTTIAPEEEGAIPCIRELRDALHFSVGHTVADYTVATEAFDAGADHLTHLFNAMPPLTHRAPGPVGAAAEREAVIAELICDGVHVHPSAVKAAFRLFGPERIVLISDSMRACGMPDGDYELGGIPVIKRGREARQADGTLAGSVTDLYSCMVEAVRMGVAPEDAVRAAAVNPPASIGLGDRFGRISEGYRASCLLVDEEWKLARVIPYSQAL